MIKKKKFKIIVSVVMMLLLIPLVAMQLTDEVVWTIADFVVMGFLLLSTGLLLEFTMRKVVQSEYRIAISITILAGFFLIWAELAVGVFGTAFAGN